MGKLQRRFSCIFFCLATMAIPYVALAQPKANFTLSAASGCKPLTETFTDKTTGGTAPYKYFWNLGNANTSTAANPSAIYITPGTYKITLNVTDSKGKTDTVSKFFTVFENPKANLKSDINTGCAPTTISFSDLSTAGSGPITGWLWDFGDGSISRAQNPKHTYTSGGKYTITLTVTDKNGCQGTVVRTNFITIITPPVVDFTAKTGGGCDAPVKISFTSKVTASSAVTYLWDFGDGNSSSSANPDNTYTQHGTYNVTLTVTDASGCVGTLIKKGYTLIGAPKPSFTYNPYHGCAPLSVDFKNTTTGGSPTDKYKWDMGDGGTSSDVNPKYTYSHSGTYSVRLIVTTANGCSDTILQNQIITVSNGFTPHFTADSIICQAPFTADFTNTSGPKTKVLYWDFGDKTKGFGESTSHTYKEEGKYTITLSVEDEEGCVETLTKTGYTNVHNTVADILYDKLEGCAPFTINITNGSSSSDTIRKVLWDFGDGSTSTDFEPGHHTYTNPGKYTIKLTVTTAKGCTASDIIYIKDGLKPHAKFIGSPLTGCLNKLRTLTYTNLTNDGIGVQADSFAWFAGYAQRADWIRNGKIEAPPGDYDVILVAYNKGCPDTFTRKKYVHIDPPWARYKLVRDSCPPNKVYFYDSSIGAKRVVYYFGDGDSSTDRNPVHTYKSIGTYYPIQVVYDSANGCSDTFSFYLAPDGLEILAPWVIQISPVSVISGCSPLKASFTFTDNGGAATYINFGDGDSVFVSGLDSVLMHITHTYTKIGVFKIRINSKNKASCLQRLNPAFQVTTFGEKAHFWVDKQRGCIPFKIMLVDSSSKSNKIKSKQYDMGNGDIIKITKDTMYYTYAKPPVNQANGFTIKQTIADSLCTTIELKKVFPTQPGAGLYVFDHSNCDTVQYEFALTHTGLGPFKYLWDFNDGTTDIDQQPIHKFNIGKYKVRLQIKDKYDCPDTLSYNIIVNNNKSVANFSVNVTTGSCPPFTVYFKDLSIFSTGGSHYWDWDFGDGSPHAHIQNPAKVYYTAGNFTVKLVIKNAIGCPDSITKKDLIVIKGPKGDYSFDNVSGCSPLTVNFSSKSIDASKLVWDLGDGTLGYGETITHIYKDAKKYIPLLILSDGSGCTYTLPPKDTIIVYPSPLPDFKFDTTCSGYVTYFHDMSNPVQGGIAEWAWDFGDPTSGSNTDKRQNPSHVYKKNGFYNVALTVTTSNGCLNTFRKSVESGNIIARIGAPKNGCINSVVQFMSNTKTDTTITSMLWTFGDGTSSKLPNPVHTWHKKGVFPVMLSVTNAKGCSDSIILPFVIGDTIAPPPPVLYRVTVQDDHSVRIDFSRYKDIDFAKYVVFKKDIAGNFVPLDSFFNIDDTTYIAKNLNTLHNVYCFKVQACNVCGYRSPLSPYHCTIDVTAKPGINAALLTWTPYVGWDVAQYQIYRQDLIKPDIFNPIGMVPGSQLIYIDSSVVCYRPMVYKIRAYEKNGYGQVSWSDTSATLPLHVASVPATEMIRATVVDNKNTLIEWKDKKTAKVKNWLLEKSSDGTNFETMVPALKATDLSVTDKKVDVQKTSYTYRVAILDSCGDLGPYSSVGKTILLKADTNNELKPYLDWSAYKEWPNGVNYYDIYIKDENNNFIYLDHTATGGETNYTDLKTDLNSLPFYCYHVVAHRNGTAIDQFKDSVVTSMSNDACLVPKSRLFVPNVFTPNNDGLNDSFGVTGVFIKEFHMKIFDRWGTKVFETNTIKDKWGGTYKNGAPLMDAYKYLIYWRGIDGEVKYLSGWVTVLE